MVEMWPLTPGGRLMETEPVEEEPRMETNSCRVRVTPRIQRAKTELKAQATKLGWGIWKAEAEPEQQRMKVEPERRRSLTEPGGRSDEVKPEKCSHEVADGRQLTKVELVD